MGDILSVLEIEWMKREAERLEELTRKVIKEGKREVKEDANDTRK